MAINENDAHVFAAFLREWRIAAGISQEAAAGLLKLKQASYSLWETGDGFPAPERVGAIAKATGRSKQELEIMLSNARLARQFSLARVADNKSGEAQVPQGAALSDSTKPNKISQAKDNAEFVQMAISRARIEFSRGFKIHLLAPEFLPFTRSDSIREQWAVNLSSDCSYHLYWFADLLLYNQIYDSEDYSDVISHTLKALRAIESFVEARLGDGKINHHVVWSGLLKHEFDIARMSPEACRTVASFIITISHLPINVVDFAGFSSGGQAPTVIRDDFCSWLEESAATGSLNGNDKIEKIAANLAARFWSIREGLVIYEDAAESLLDNAFGYVIPRSGRGSWDPSEKEKERAPRVLSSSEVDRVIKLLGEIRECTATAEEETVRSKTSVATISDKA
jgi:transcriptional regulator with XRE-family HTH domain